MFSIINYLHAPTRLGIILAKLIIPLYTIKSESTSRVVRNVVTWQAERGLTTRGVKLSSSSSPLSSSSKYDLFFPSFCRGYEIDSIDSYIASEEMARAFRERERKLANSYPMTCPDFEDKPHYSYDDLHNNEPVIIQQGQYLDVISLLSTHADDLVQIGSDSLVKANDLRGKYIILCCGFVPSLWIGSYSWWNLSRLSSELSQPHIKLTEILEIVIVPKMRQKWDNDEGAFDHFSSAFLGCLSVPFTDKHRCDYICKSLNFEGKPRCILVDPFQKVLHVDFNRIVRYGARGFPFTDEHLSFLHYEACWNTEWSPSIVSLAGLLCCESNPSSFLLRKIDSEETISVEQLNKHHVLLYMFKRGYLLKVVQNIYQQCRDQGLDLEIVLVCLPFNTPTDPEAYEDVVHYVLKKHQVSNWWVFPYNNSACIRLFDLSRSSVDSVFIVGPNNKFVDRQAGDVLQYFGPHFGVEAYPFTMEGLLRAFLQRLDTVTLESLFLYDYVYRDYECDDSKIMPLSELKGRNVLVLVEYYTDVNRGNNATKKKESDFEVIYVPIVNLESDSEYPKLASEIRESIYESKTKRLICPFEDPKQSQFLMNHDAFLLSKGSYSAKKGLPLPSMLAFGKDGHLCSLEAMDHLRSNEHNAYLDLPDESGNQILREEIMTELFFEFELADDTAASLKS